MPSDLLPPAIDPDTLFALLSHPPAVLGPWERTAAKSERHTPGSTDGGCFECGAGMAEAVTIEHVKTRNGYRCHNAHESPGKGPRCRHCGEELIHEPNVEAWRVTALPDDIAQHARRGAWAWCYHSAGTREAAEAWCDERAVEAGVMLANGGGP